MVLFWTMDLDPAEPEVSPFAKADISPMLMRFVAEVDGTIAASATLERLFVAPGVTVEPVQAQGLAGRLFRPAATEPRPGVLVVGGSSGGLRWSEQTAALLAAHGYTTLALAYFAYEHLPARLVNIPLEYFETAIYWLQADASVLDDRLAVMGLSRGGELVLLLGATFPQVKAVVAYVPGAVIFGGFGGDVEGVAAWSYRGTPLPFLRDPTTPAEKEAFLGQEPIPLTPYFHTLFADPAAVELATIPVERTRGPILLISGQDDQMWPSTMMSEMVIKRLEAHAYPFPYHHLSYAGAGHIIGFPYLPTTVNQGRHPVDGKVYALGGNARGNAFARQDSWTQVLRFLREHLGR